MCEDDPSLAVPIAPAKPAPVEVAGPLLDPLAAALAEASAAANGSAPTAVMTRTSALQHLASAKREGSVAALAPDAEATSAAPEPEPKPAPPARDVTGRLLGVVPDLRAGVGRFDARVHEDAIVFAPVKGVDPVLAGRVVGTLVLGPLGLLLGDRLGRKVAFGQRAKRLAVASPGAAVFADQLVAVSVERLPWGGRVQIGAAGSGGRRLRWSNRDVETNEVAGLLQTVAGRRFSMLPFGGGLRVAHRAGVILLWLAIAAMVAIPVKAIAFPPAEPGAELPSAARSALRSACPPWQAAPLSGPGLVAAVAQVQRDLERAADAAPAELGSLRPAIAAVAAYAPKAGDASAPLAEAASFSSGVDAIDAACARVSR